SVSVTLAYEPLPNVVPIALPAGIPVTASRVSVGKLGSSLTVPPLAPHATARMASDASTMPIRNRYFEVNDRSRLIPAPDPRRFSAFEPGREYQCRRASIKSRPLA